MSTLRANTLQTLDSLQTVSVADLVALSETGDDVAPFVSSIAALKLLDKTTKTHAVATGYYVAGDGGGGTFRLDAADSTSVDNGCTVIVGADGGRWKLLYTNCLSVKQAGAQNGQDIAAKLNLLGQLLFDAGGGVIDIEGEYTVSTKVNLFPNVQLIGGGSGLGTRITSTHTGTTFETYRPTGYVPLCIGVKVRGLTILQTLVGGARVGTCFGMRNCMQCEVYENEISNYNVAFNWNSGSTAGVIVQAYFNKVYQNMVKPCNAGHFFGGAANRNTFDTNSYADNNVAYDFSQADNYSETNTFLNENIEGCHSWAEWSANVFSQTWVGICIENPASNGYVCSVKDPGRQVFVNLSLIPLGNEAAIIKYDLTPGVTSMVLGSAASSGGARLGVTLNEDLNLYGVLTQYGHQANHTYTGTINAGLTATINIPLADALLNDRVDVYALRSLNGCTMQAYANNGSVSVDIVNGTGNNITISDTEISVILKRVG